jgi:glycosyltransferase involved in cell wall biosynthesis
MINLNKATIKLKIKKNRVLVAMPCYNSSTMVVEAIMSVFNQTYKNYLLVCCDDKSTDNTLGVLKQNQKDFKYALIENHGNLGTGHTVNKIFEIYEQGNFEFMTWVSSDNLLQPDFLRKHVEKLNEGCAITYCGWSCFGKVRPEQYFPDKDLLHLKTLFKLGPGFMFRKKLWDKVKPFQRLAGEDYYFAVECALANARFGYVDDVLVKYRVHDNSVTSRLERGVISGMCSGEAIVLSKGINAVNGDNGYL